MHSVQNGRCVDCGYSVGAALPALNALQTLAALEGVQPGIATVLRDLRRRQVKHRRTIKRIVSGLTVKPKQEHSLQRDLVVMAQLFRLKAEFQFRVGEFVYRKLSKRSARSEAKRDRELKKLFNSCLIALSVLDSMELSRRVAEVSTLPFADPFDSDVHNGHSMEGGMRGLSNLLGAVEPKFALRLSIKAKGNGFELGLYGDEEGGGIPQPLLELVVYAGKNHWRFKPGAIPEAVLASIPMDRPLHPADLAAFVHWIGGVLMPAGSANVEDMREREAVPV